MRAIEDAKAAVTGVVEMLSGRTDFHPRFDVSTDGLVRSFFAMVLAIPFNLFSAAVQNTLAARSAGALDGVEPYSTTFVIARWALSWGYFPLLAAAVTAILGRRKSFAPWVVVQNWTHLLVLAIQAVPLALIVSGAANAGATLLLGTTLLTVYAYVCAAKAGLNVSWPLAIMAGSANLAAMLLVEMGLREVIM